MLQGPDPKISPRLYPAIEPFKRFHLAVGDGHELYVEICGTRSAQPVVVLHGGPGAGSSPFMRRFFDPKRYQIVLFDQRGTGRSTPRGGLESNTTWHLVEDIERLRAHLDIERWQVFGGSWGSTLSLAYAETHPERVTELVLRGIFLLRDEEIHWYYQEGASYIYPDAWEHFLAPIPEAERGDLLHAYHARLTSQDEVTRLEAAKAWSVWEGSTSKLIVDPNLIARTGEARFAEAFARIECHYFVNHGFLPDGEGLLERVDRIRHIPGVIVQGRYDVV